MVPSEARAPTKRKISRFLFWFLSALYIPLFYYFGSDLLEIRALVNKESQYVLYDHDFWIWPFVAVLYFGGFLIISNSRLNGKTGLRITLAIIAIVSVIYFLLQPDTHQKFFNAISGTDNYKVCFEGVLHSSRKTHHYYIFHHRLKVCDQALFVNKDKGQHQEIIRRLNGI